MEKPSKEELKKAFAAGAMGKMSSEYSDQMAYKNCKKMKGNPMADAYVRGWENSGV